MAPIPKDAWKVEFFKNDRGESPPLEFINGLPPNEKSKVYFHLKLLRELGTQIREPHAKPLKGYKPLWELRPMPNRLIYVAFKGNRFVVLHAFDKKQDKTPKRHLELAQKRLDELLEREK